MLVEYDIMKKVIVEYFDHSTLIKKYFVTKDRKKNNQTKEHAWALLFLNE